MIRVQDIMRVMNVAAPLSLTQEWDNCGLVVGDEAQVVNKLFIALDPTMEVIDEAILCSADMIVTHHPLTLHKFNKINASSQEGQKIFKLIQNKIALYCAHTNLDQTLGGLNDELAQRIGLKDYEVLENTGVDDQGKVLGFGRIGFLEAPVNLSVLAQQVKEVLDLDGIQIVGDGERLIKKVAVGSGSSMEALDHAVSKGADVFITGDVKYHGALEALEKGICLIDATHFGTENIVRYLLEKLFSKELPELNLILDNKSRNPIQMI